MTIYLDNSCEIHFHDSSKLTLSPCGTEFVYSTYLEDSDTRESFKYRTAYPTSTFSKYLSIILKQRNKFCDRPFVSPTLLENNKEIWLSSEDICELKWSTKDQEIEYDYSNKFLIWNSICKRGKLKLHFNKKLLVISYPIKVPINEFDEFETNFDITKSYQKYADHVNKTTNSTQVKVKNILKYTNTEEEHSIRNLPQKYINLYETMQRLVDKVSLEQDEILCLELPKALPLTCEATHLHKFEHIETLNEPKVVYFNKAYYKLHYKSNKAIEVLPLDDNGQSYSNYLINDSPTGRYYSYLTIDEKTSECKEYKLCIDNIPSSLKLNVKNCINYSNILLKRLNSIYNLSKHITCQKNELFVLDQSEIASQNVVEDVGHFKYFKNNTLFILFIDKVKLYVDSTSIKMYNENNFLECYCRIWLPDSSEHEINFMENCMNQYFERYLGFLRQWLEWLFKKNETLSEKEEEKIDLNAIQSHLKQIRYYNLLNDQNNLNMIYQENIPKLTESSNHFSMNSIEDLMKENMEFLKKHNKI